jgi:type IV secretory pathway VirD2 relaxase
MNHNRTTILASCEIPSIHGHKCKQFSDVIEFSQAMLKEAEAGNWENVFAVEKQRSNTLKELFSPPFTNNDKAENNDKILQILSINKKLEVITSKARDDIRNQAG